MLNRDISEPLYGSESGTFAEDTIVRRLPEIARRVLAENDWQIETRRRLETLIAEMPRARLRPLREDGSADVRSWNRALRDLAKEDWLSTPWFVAEMYFFRRILEATGYYAPGDGQGRDPYGLQKRQGLEAALPATQLGAERVLEWLAETPSNRAERDRQAPVTLERLAQVLKLSLWGNQADLSLWPAGLSERPEHASWQQGEAFLLCDQAAQAAMDLTRQPAGRVEVLLDNAGQELAFDLLMAATLLGSGTARQVVLQVKPHPTYVSDATTQDVLRALAALSAQGGTLAVLGSWLEGWLNSGRLRLKTDYFWTSPYAGWEMPSRLRRRLAGARLVISKGDANYRRLVGDRHWAFETPFAQVVSYFPAPLLALRVCKSEVMVGLAAGQVARVAAQDARWLTDGKWGAIQFRG